MSNSLVVRKNSGNSLTILKSGSVSVNLPPATNATLGGIIVGANLSITGNGVLSVADTFQPKLANTTYGLTDTGIISNESEYYVNGEYVNKGLDKYYTGLRGQKDLPTGELYNELYAVGTYRYNANGTLALASSLEFGEYSAALVASGSTGFSTLISRAGFASIVASNATSQCVLSLGDGTMVGQAENAYFELRGKQGGTGYNQEDYRFAFGHSSSLSNGITLEQVARKSLLGFIYAYNNSGVDYKMTNGLSFDNTAGLDFFVGAGTSTSFRHTIDAVISGVRTGTEIRASRNKVELLYLNATPVYTANSILTQGYADTRYQAVGAYLTSANLTYANITGTPTTLAGYGITDGLTSANLTPYLTISSANSTYAVLGHTHAIANVTGLQTALDAKLPSANFTYANLTGTPNLTLYLTTANAAATYSVLTHTHVIANVTGLQTALDSKLPSANFTYANLTGPQNLLDTELIRAKLRDYSETVSSPTISSGTLVLNLETSNIFTVSLNAAITTLTISNPPASGSGGSFTLIFTADGTARAVTWPASIKWAGGTAPVITSASGKIDTFAFFSSDGGTNWQGYVGGQNF